MYWSFGVGPCLWRFYSLLIVVQCHWRSNRQFGGTAVPLEVLRSRCCSATGGCTVRLVVFSDTGRSMITLVVVHCHWRLHGQASGGAVPPEVL